MAPGDKVYLAVLGVGGVGKCFLAQLAGLAKRRPELQLVLCYLGTGSHALYSDDYAPIDLDDTLGRPSDAPTRRAPLALDALATYLASAPSKRVVLADNTSSQAVADAYPTLLGSGISIVTPNKKAFSGSWQLWRDVFAAAARSGARVYHESSVGAGLPVISTLKDLVDTGDEVTRIEGVFSGTMSFLFNSFAPATSTASSEPPTWSAEVIRAKQLGYTEPDPRDDLNGLDVARKLTILARLAGLPIESPAAFPVESLIPAELAAEGEGEGDNKMTGDEFLARLPEFDARMAETRAAAEREGKVVRFVGSIDVPGRRVRVGLESFDRTHPIAGLRGSDNIISFYTRRYGANPLIVQGAGAGGDVTAMGVLADLLKVVSQI